MTALKHIVLGCMLIASLVATTGVANAGTATRRVKAVQQYTAGQTFIILDGMTNYSCNRPGNLDVPFIDRNDPSAENAVQVALAAQLSGRDVYVAWDSACKISLIKIQ